jgi:hypothetical protein
LAAENSGWRLFHGEDLQAPSSNLAATPLLAIQTNVWYNSNTYSKVQAAGQNYFAGIGTLSRNLQKR